MELNITDEEAVAGILRYANDRSDELVKLRISIARLAQAMKLGHLIPKPKSGDDEEVWIDMQEAPYEILHMAAITDRGWNTLVGEMVEKWQALNAFWRD